MAQSEPGRSADLFGQHDPGGRHALGPQAWVLRGRALACADAVLAALRQVVREARLRHMTTPGGREMSVALTNCGRLGWVSDRRGYRYTRDDPQTGRPWPALPAVLAELAACAAAEAGFDGFVPDACLVNRYLPGTRMSLHQDRNERDYSQPIVSVSLGMPAVFLFGGLSRSDRSVRVPLLHGDVAVWGGVDRLRYHGILPLAGEPHPVLGSQRLNVTLRKAG